MNFDEMATQESIDKTIAALAPHGIEGIVAENKEDALQLIRNIIPERATVMNGSSTTLQEIGYMEYLQSGKHPWQDLHAMINAENDDVKRAQLRKESVLSDYYLGSVHAVTENGEMVIASNTGSQLPHLVYTSPNLILVVGTQKIVPTLETAMARLEKYVKPLEDERSMKAYGVASNISKVVIFKHENQMSGRKIRMILVKEKLGF